jgi:hypothetical protein
MTNTNSETGIRYGVIALNNLDGDVAHDLMFGSQATDHSWAEAVSDAKKQAEDEYEALIEECAIAAAETGADREADWNRRSEDWQEEWLTKRDAEDMDTWVEHRTEHLMDRVMIEGPNISGKLDGVDYQISWLGGAPLLWVLHSPNIVEVHSLCSPCVPNAGNLDSEIVPANQDGYVCYGIPEEWTRVTA